MGGDIAVIRLSLVEVLDQVVPDLPLPDDLSAVRIGRFHLGDRIRIEDSVAEHLCWKPGGEAFRLGFVFHHQHEDVAIGQGRDVMVLLVLIGGI